MKGYIVAIDEDDVIWLAWAAGIATGSGNAQAGNAIGGILTRLQPFEQEEGAESLDVLIPEDQLVPEQDTAPQLELVENRVPDPNFMPPTPAPPMNPDQNFGAGPPPGPIVNP